MASQPPSLPADKAYIPDRGPSDTYRTLVLLFDGTGDKSVLLSQSLDARLTLATREDADVAVSLLSAIRRLIIHRLPMLFS